MSLPEGINQILEENRSIAKLGGNTAKVAKGDIERKLGESVVTKNNNLNYEYIDDKLISNK